VAPLSEPEEGPDYQRESEELGLRIAKLGTDFTRTIQIAGLANDPIYPLLDLMLSSLRLQWRLHNQAVRYFHDASDRLDRQYHETIKKAELSIRQGEQSLEAKQAGIIDQLAPKIASTIDIAVRQRVKILKIRILAGWGIAVLAVALLPSAFTYTAGLGTGRSQGENAAHAIQAAMAAGPDAAVGWGLLMANNSPGPELAECRKSITTDEYGRRSCPMPVWLDPPPGPAQ
jgi:hypothetical protein